MKKLLLVKACFFMSLWTFGQEQIIPKCSQHHKLEEFLENASLKEIQRHNASVLELEQFTQTYIQNHPELLSNNSERTISYTIPVVFHVIHENGSENISDAQILDALTILNRDYQLQNTDANDVVADYQGIPADIEIEFKLAKRDNDGNCTNGITRTYSQASSSGDGATQVSVVQNAQGNWPGNKYLNIFIVKDAGGAAGYTYNPSWGVGTGMENGIIILHNYVGSIGTSSAFSSRALTHEVGHWLNLAHTWGGTNDPGLTGNCSSDDNVSDTPNTIGWTTCDLTGTTCDGVLDNVENYMEYSYCSKMFTPGQKARMHAALNSSVGGRINVVSSANLTATGVNEPDQLCNVDFTANRFEICEGGSIDFSDLSYFNPTSWDWTFNGGTPSSSSQQNPTITYNTPGEYEVTLTASDGANSLSETKSAYIKVLSSTGTSTPVGETFESLPQLPTTMWFPESPTDDWQVVSNAGANSTASLKLYNYGADGGNTHTVTSNTIDLSGSGPVLISFDYAYKEYQNQDNESLRLYVSNDCGTTWNLIKTYQGSQFGSGVQSSNFIPSNDDWIREEISTLSGMYQVANFRLRFEFTSQGSNNFYLDNLFVGRTSADIENFDNNSISLYPNPTQNSFSIHGLQSKPSSISILDISGQKIKSISTASYKQIDVSGLSSGVYLISIQVEDKIVTKKMIIQK